MAPKGAASQSSSSRTADTLTPDTSAAEVIAAQQPETDRLTALLQADNAQAQPAEQTVTTLVESIVRSLERIGTPSRASSKLIKIPDPRELTDRVDPTFESWKLQMQDKLRIHSDSFPTEVDKWRTSSTALVGMPKSTWSPDTNQNQRTHSLQVRR